MIALYARVSTDQQEQGLASQLAELRRFVAQKYAGEVAIEFEDDGYTGAVLERPSMDKLRAMMRAGQVRVLLSYDTDRLSRVLAHQCLLMNEADRYGVVLDFVRGGFEQSDTGRMALQMRGVIAEFERAQIKARTQRGRLEAARNGKSGGGRRPLGYKCTAGELIVIESEAATVRRIFDALNTGVSVREIAFRLNADGILPQRGRRWATSSIHRILRNTTYYGDAAYNRRKRGPDGRMTFRPEAEWIPFAVPAIIDRATFDQAQEQLQKNARFLSGRKYDSYLLKGLLRCGICSMSFCGHPSHGKQYYRCRGRDRLRAAADPCKAPTYSAPKVEKAVIDAVRAVLKGGLLQQKAVAHAPKLAVVDYAAEIATVRREVEHWKAKEERAARFMVSPDLADSQHVFQAELALAAKQRRAAEARLESFDRARDAEKLAANRGHSLQDVCRRALRGLAKLKREQWPKILQLLLQEVRISGQTLELHGVLPMAFALGCSHTQNVVDGSIPNGVPFVFKAVMPESKRKVG